jgi:hypothetical protein
MPSKFDQAMLGHVHQALVHRYYCGFLDVPRGIEIRSTSRKIDYGNSFLPGFAYLGDDFPY